MSGHHLIIIGGGAAGLAAAIAAAGVSPSDHGPVTITIVDAASSPGRKILAAGNGRCNLTNRVQRRDCYRTENGPIPERFFRSDWDREIAAFMRSIGILMHERKDGYLYPRTDQASNVLQALIRETERSGVAIRSGVRVMQCEKSSEGSGFDVMCRIAGSGGDCGTPGRRSASGRPETSIPVSGDCGTLTRQSAGSDATNHIAGFPSAGAGRDFMIHADRVILACGGMVSKTYGCMGDGYRLAGAFGHTAARPVPSLCALHSDAPHIKAASGVRTAARVSLLLDGQVLAKAQGELQMTDHGISGIPVFQVSRYASLSAGITATIDFLPEVSGPEWKEECARRLACVRADDTLGDFCRGLIPDKIAIWLLADLGLVREKKLIRLLPEDARRFAAEGSDAFADALRNNCGQIRQLLQDMRCKEISITGTEGFEKAQVTAGGIRLREISDTMESQYAKGLYFAGEVLDVDGICGGYNLTWAFHSGLLAGRSAAESLQEGKNC